MFSSLLDYFLPPVCLLCEQRIYRPEEIICSGCDKNLAYKPHSCLLCAAPLSAQSGDICGKCLNKKPLWESAFTPFEFKDEIAFLIHKFKYGKKPYIHKLVSRHLSIYLADKLSSVDLIIPVPLHNKRIHERGFNQSELIAGSLAQQTGINMNPKTCIRVRHTVSQTGLSAKERRKNLTGAFAAVKPELLKNKNILLLDDVYTTGATFTSLAKTLKRSGCGKITVAAAAKTSIQS